MTIASLADKEQQNRASQKHQSAFALRQPLPKLLHDFDLLSFGVASGLLSEPLWYCFGAARRFLGGSLNFSTSAFNENVSRLSRPRLDGALNADVLKNRRALQQRNQRRGVFGVALNFQYSGAVAQIGKIGVVRNHLRQLVEDSQHLAPAPLQIGQGANFFAQLLQLIFFAAQRLDRRLELLILPLQLAQTQLVFDRIAQLPRQSTRSTRSPPKTVLSIDSDFAAARSGFSWRKKLLIDRGFTNPAQRRAHGWQMPPRGKRFEPLKRCLRQRTEILGGSEFSAGNAGQRTEIAPSIALAGHRARSCSSSSRLAP